MGTPWIITRDAVQQALPAAASVATNAVIDRACASATESVEELTLRRFYPVVATRYFYWPNYQFGEPWRVYFEQPDQLISLTSLTVGGTSISTGNVLLEPANSGPPYSRLEIDRSTSSAFSSGNTLQRAGVVVGLWGYRNDTATAGALAEALDATETGVDVTGAAAVALGVGSLLVCESERMIVTNRSWLTSGQTLLTTALTAALTSVAVNVTTGSAFAIGEQILLDSERMLITDISSNVLTVARAQGGTVLAAHSTGTTIYVSRTLTVERGALGTTAATHADATALSVFKFPGLVEDLGLAEAVNEVLQTTAGWGRTTGGDNPRELRGAGLADLRKRVQRRHGRRARVGAI